MHNVTVETVCGAPVGLAPYAYTAGLIDRTGFELVAAARPGSGQVAGGVLTGYDLMEVVAQWSGLLADGQCLAPVALHDGRTVVTPGSSHDTTAGEGSEERHLCMLEEWLPVREVAWQVTRRRVSVPLALRTSPNRQLIDELELPPGVDTDGAAYELLLHAARYATDRFPGRILELAATGALQLDIGWTPEALTGSLRALADDVGQAEELLAAEVAAHETADLIADRLLLPYRLGWTPEFDLHRQGLRAVLAGAARALALHSWLPVEAANRSRATALSILSGGRHGARTRLPWQERVDEFAADVAALDDRAWTRLAARLDIGERLQPAVARVRATVRAAARGAGIFRLPTPTVAPTIASGRPDTIIDNAVADVLVERLSGYAVDAEVWQVMTRPFVTAGLNIPEFRDASG